MEEQASTNNTMDTNMIKNASGHSFSPLSFVAGIFSVLLLHVVIFGVSHSVEIEQVLDAGQPVDVVTSADDSTADLYYHFLEDCVSSGNEVELCKTRMDERRFVSDCIGRRGRNEAECVPLWDGTLK